MRLSARVSRIEGQTYCTLTSVSVFITRLIRANGNVDSLKFSSYASAALIV